MLKIYTKFSLLSGAMVYRDPKIKIHQQIIFNEPRKFDAADIKCFTVNLTQKHGGSVFDP